MFKIAREGYPFILVFFTVTAITFTVGNLWIALLPFVVTTFMVYFFRDPDRIPPEGKGLFISPADGKIIVVKEIFEKEYINKNTKHVSIFMSPLNVHVNRSPYDGKVKTVKHTHGKFQAAYTDEASLTNENIAMVLETEHGEILVRQIAGFVARRAVCRVNQGDILKRGERYGIIKFSSRVDIYLPIETDIKVKLGDKVKAGETIIGVMSEKL